MAGAHAVGFHRKLLNDPQRMSAYRRAIHAVVKPGDVVLDVGSGSGVLALFACQAGARKVYCVERGDIIAVARQLATHNLYADRIVFLQQDAQTLQLDEAVDVIQSELISKAVLGQHMAELIGHCRDRHLRQGGVILPAEVLLCLAPVESETAYACTRLPACAEYDLDFAALQQYSHHLPLSTRIGAEALLAAGEIAYRYEALAAPLLDQVDTHLRFKIDRAATLHGFAAWFSSVLSPGVPLDNAPPGSASWDNLFLPLPRPLELTPGQVIEIHLQARDDRRMPSIWRWQTQLKQGDETLASFDQSSFHAQLNLQGQAQPR